MIKRNIFVDYDDLIIVSYLLNLLFLRPAELQREHLQPPAVGPCHDSPGAQRTHLRHGRECHRLGQQSLVHPILGGKDGQHAQLQ